MRKIAPPPEEIEDLRRRHGRFHERRFEFTEPKDAGRPLAAEKLAGARGWVILVPVDIYRQVILVRKVGERDWFFPGGRVEPGETIEETAERELLEEAGLEAESSVLKALWWWTVNFSDGPASLAYFVFLQTVVGEAEIHDKGEIEEVRPFREPPKDGLYKTLIHDALADSGMLHQWGIDFAEEQKFGTG